MDLATGERQQLTFSSGDKRAPTWSPDGRIAYHTSNQTCYLVEPGSEEPRPLLANLWPIKDLVWSPDGLRVAFSRVRTDLVDSINLWLAEADGTNPRLITNDPGIQHHAAWSPGGTQIAYIGSRGYLTSELYVVNIDGTRWRQLTTNRAHEALPAWSPDGTQLAFVSDVTGDYEICVVQPDGSDLKPLTSAPGLDTYPAWSPDGTKIAFTTNRSGILEIWVMNMDGSEQRPLIQDEAGVCDVAWR